MAKIIIKNIGNNEISIVKDIRDLLCTDLNNAKEIVDCVKQGKESELDVKDAGFALDILRSDGATVYLYGEEAIAPDSDNKVGSDEKNISDNEAAKASNKNITSYKREVEQKICSMVNQYYKKRYVFFSQGVTLFALWIERFNTLEIQTGNETVKLLFMKSGGELKEKIEETLNKYNNSGERYQETRFSDEKGKSIWKLILSVAWNLFLICLAYI